MKTIRKLLSFGLSMIMLLGLTACAQAADPQTAATQPAQLQPMASQTQPAGCSDVPESAAYAQAVAWCRERGLMNGISDTEFSPNGTLTRAMLATVLYRAAGEPDTANTPSFTDTQMGVWYSDAVAWAAAQGHLRGYGGGLFGPDDPVTVEQLDVVLGRYLGTGVQWTGDPARNVSATRAQIAQAFYERLGPGKTSSHTLVAYFSRTGENYNVGVVEKGNTAIVAEMIAAQNGADLFEITPTAPYPSDYSEMLEVARKEAADDARPEISSVVENWDSYDVIFLGYPIWNGEMPNIVTHFLESYDFTGKIIVPFCTHEGSGLSRTVEHIQTVCPNVTVLDGLAIRGQTAQGNRAEAESSVKTWLNGLADKLPSHGSASAPAVGEFDLEKGTVLLNNGIEMPILGIGCFRLSDEQAENSVYWALRDGYRLIDTARIYGNEAGVGRGIRRAIADGYVTREEVFVTTKMWTSDFDNGDAAIDASLERLGLDYIDLMILHHSQPSNDVAAYQALERAVESGKLRSIGLSNFYTGEDFDRLAKATTIVPALLQNETHPYHQSGDMKEHLKQYGTVMESWFPLGGRGNTQTLFNDPTISAIAAAHGKTSAQVILRWHLQAGNIAIPGSSNENHIQENFEIFDFELTADEMAQMTALDKNQRFAGY